MIAAIHNACIGGGIDMTSACDIRYATQDSFFQIKVGWNLPLGEGFIRQSKLLLSTVKVVYFVWSYFRISNMTAKNTSMTINFAAIFI